MGLDVVMRPVSAYSTLGYFTDPVLSTMLEYDDAGLAELIIHELTHGTVFAKGFTDFNESLASFVGDTGSIMFLRFRGFEEEEISSILAKRGEDRGFRAFMTTVVARLDSFYNMNLPIASVLEERKEVFRAAQSRFDRSQFPSGRYDHFERWEINNAALLSYRRYNRNTDLFEELHAAKLESLRETLALCSGCASTQNPWSCLRDSLGVLKRL
jgi:predicted aminopeptidase